MPYRPFDKPIALALPAGDVYVADSVWELEQYLELFWPDKDPGRQRLMRLCADGLDGWVSADMIRQEAIKAAQGLGLLRPDKDIHTLHFRAVDQSMKTWQVQTE